MKREPLQHILGSQPFRQVTVRVTADAMVPAPRRSSSPSGRWTSCRAARGRS